ncbi:MAG TPA: phosphatase PAP2 family protein [Devosiaceae bacterium]|jgi:hypothetical protein
MSIVAVDNLAGGGRRIPVLAIAIAAYVAVAAVIAPNDFSDMCLQYLHQAIILPPVLLVGLCMASLIRRPRAPVSFIIDVLRDRLLWLILVVAIFCVGMAAFTTIKIAIPHLVPFYADRWLADIDGLLVPGGPGLLAHALVPGWAAYSLAFLYGPIWFLGWFGLLGFVALNGDKRLRGRYFWSMALLLCVVGTVLAVLLSSVGPVFYDRIYASDRFGDLMQLLANSSVGSYMHDETAYLYDNYVSNGHGMGTGISAMPSVHIAVVTLNAWMLSSLNRWVGAVAWGYVAAIVLGSVYLGWHYLADGAVSLFAVSLIWWLTGRFSAIKAR